MVLVPPPARARPAGGAGRRPGAPGPAVRTGLRGIANFLNPLADNFTWARLLLSLLVGLAVPVAAVLWLGGEGRFVIREAASVTGLAPATCTTALLALLMTVTAALVGWLFVCKSFIWGFLLSYAVLRPAGPLGAGTVLAVRLWTGAVASWAAGRRERRSTLV